MIAGSIQNVAKQITHEYETKRDYLADTRKLNFSDNGEISFEVGGDARVFKPTRLCLNQIAERVGIPVKYLDRMQKDAPGLLATNVNHWFKNQPETRLLRTLQNGDAVARAFLSNSYRPLDNYDIASHVLPVLANAGCEIKSAAVTESRLYIQAVTPRIVGEIKKVGDIVHAGVVISNSEVGCGALDIEELIWTLRCTNGMIGSSVMRRAHLGRNSGDSENIVQLLSNETRQADDKAFWLKVRDMVKGTLTPERFNALVSKLNDSTTKELGNPVDVVEVASRRFGFTNDESKSVLEHFCKGGDLTQYGLLSAVTRAAEDFESYDRAIEFERLGGTILELKATDFAKN